jgi:Uma2 family endonuclease
VSGWGDFTATNCKKKTRKAEKVARDSSERPGCEHNLQSPEMYDNGRKVEATMNVAKIRQIEYPESDGEPLGETDLHIHWIIRLRDILKYRYRGERVYVGADLMLYYMEGEPHRNVSPDVFVVLDCDPRFRRTFKTWEEGRAPDVVFEITSKSSKDEDASIKPQKYEMMGVREYFLYDPDGEYLHPPLLGYRRGEGRFERIEPNDRGLLVSQSLGITLELDGPDLMLRDAATGSVLLTHQEAAEAQREAAESQREAERIAREKAEAEREAERIARRAADAQREAEQVARQAADARNAALEEELQRLREQLEGRD